MLIKENVLNEVGVTTMLIKSQIPTQIMLMLKELYKVLESIRAAPD